MLLRCHLMVDNKTSKTVEPLGKEFEVDAGETVATLLTRAMEEAPLDYRQRDEEDVRLWLRLTTPTNDGDWILADDVDEHPRVRKAKSRAAVVHTPQGENEEDDDSEEEEEEEVLEEDLPEVLEIPPASAIPMGSPTIRSTLSLPDQSSEGSEPIHIDVLLEARNITDGKFTRHVVIRVTQAPVPPPKKESSPRHDNRQPHRHLSFIPARPQIGQYLDACFRGMWMEAKIVGVDDGGKTLRIHYLSFPTKMDERVPANDASRLQPRHVKVPDWRAQLRVEDEVDLHRSAFKTKALSRGFPGLSSTTTSTTPAVTPVVVNVPTTSDSSSAMPTLSPASLEGEDSANSTGGKSAWCVGVVQRIDRTQDPPRILLRAHLAGTLWGSKTREVWISSTSEKIAPRHMHLPRKAISTSSLGMSPLLSGALGGSGGSSGPTPASAASVPHTLGKPPAPGAVGFRNLGNTCYMNSMLQCLMHSSSRVMTEYFAGGTYERDLNRRNPLGTGGLVADAFAALAKSYWSGEYTEMSPIEFRQSLIAKARQFQGYQQQDCHDLYVTLMDYLHEDLNRVREKPQVPAVESAGRNDRVVFAEYERARLQRDDSVVHDNFAGVEKSHLTCPHCGTESTTFSLYTDLELALPSKEPILVTVLVFPAARGPAVVAPLRLTVKVPKRGTGRDLAEAIASAIKMERAPAPCSGEDLIVAEVWQNRLTRRLFSPAWTYSPSTQPDPPPSLSSLSPGAVVVAWELESPPPPPSPAVRREKQREAWSRFRSEYAGNDGRYPPAHFVETWMKELGGPSREAQLALAKELSEASLEYELAGFFPSAVARRAAESCLQAGVVVEEALAAWYHYNGASNNDDGNRNGNGAKTQVRYYAPRRVAVELRHITVKPFKTVRLPSFISVDVNDSFKVLHATIRRHVMGELLAPTWGPSASRTHHQHHPASSPATAMNVAASSAAAIMELPSFTPPRAGGGASGSPATASSAAAQQQQQQQRSSPTSPVEDPASSASKVALKKKNKKKKKKKKNSKATTNSASSSPNVTPNQTPRRLDSNTTTTSDDAGEEGEEDDEDGDDEEQEEEAAAALLYRVRAEDASGPEDYLPSDGLMRVGALESCGFVLTLVWTPSGVEALLSTPPPPPLSLSSTSSSTESDGRGDTEMITPTDKEEERAARERFRVLDMDMGMRPNWVRADRSCFRYLSASAQAALKRESALELSELLDHYRRREQMDDFNQYYCPKCKKHVNSFKQMSLWTLPAEVLVLTLVRFQNRITRREKIADFVRFPLEGLDMAPHAEGIERRGGNAEDWIYDLRAVSNHIGELGGGHYTAYVRAQDGAWFLMNDSRAEPVADPSEVVSPQAYVLFYQRRQRDNKAGKKS